MKTFNGWTGVNTEIKFLLDTVLLDLEEVYPGLSSREIKALLCASLASNVVQNEIREQMAFEYEQGEDGSYSRNKLNALLDMRRKATA